MVSQPHWFKDLMPSGRKVYEQRESLTEDSAIQVDIGNQQNQNPSSLARVFDIRITRSHILYH